MEHILVIDDDSIILRTVQTILGKSGYFVDTLGSFEEIPQPWPCRRWDCIICDYYLYDRTGQEILSLVRAAKDDSPFIFISSNEDMGAVVQAIKSGADDYIIKPLDPQLLILCIERNIKIAKEHRVLAMLQRDQAALETERNVIMNWRSMYAAKEVRQTEMMIQQLSRSVNRVGGFSWLEIADMDMKELPDGRVSLSQPVMNLITSISKEQKRIIEYLDFMARIKTLELPIQKMPMVDFFHHLAEIANTRLIPLCNRYGHELKLAIPGGFRDTTVKVNLEYLEKILFELACNAIKFSPEGSYFCLYLSWARKQTQEHLEVVFSNEATEAKVGLHTDETIQGIPYEYCEQVFDMYNSLDHGTMHVLPEEEWADGTGLYLARELMRRMGNWIRAGNNYDMSGPKPRMVVNIALEFPL